MNVGTQTLLWGAQRATAVLLGVCVIVHLLTIIYTVRNGLSAAEILGHTQNNPAWAAFYLLFVTAVAIHAPIGLRAILSEWFHWRGRVLEISVLMTGLGLAVLGFRAVWAVYT